MKVREDQLGAVNFTWVSRRTWASEGIKNRFMLGEDSQSQSEYVSQNAQSTTTTTGEHGGMTEPDYSQFFSGTNLKLVFEKANIKGKLLFILSFLSDKF